MTLKWTFFSISDVRCLSPPLLSPCWSFCALLQATVNAAEAVAGRRYKDARHVTCHIVLVYTYSYHVNSGSPFECGALVFLVRWWPRMFHIERRYVALLVYTIWWRRHAYTIYIHYTAIKSYRVILAWRFLDGQKPDLV